jgi:hypothetical protein
MCRYTIHYYFQPRIAITEHELTILNKILSVLFKHVESVDQVQERVNELRVLSPKCEFEGQRSLSE